MTDLPIEHHEIGAWAEDIKGHSDQVCGVQCACGETFDGFDTPIEAREQLDAHIEDERRLEFGRKVLAARIRLGLTIEKASAFGGVTTKTWQRIERGERVVSLSLAAVDMALGFEAGMAFSVVRGDTGWPTPESAPAPASVPVDGPSVLQQLIAASVAADRMRVLSGGGS